MSRDFSRVASTYIAASPELSGDFVSAVIKHFRITSEFKILELGCGYGALALSLASTGACVEALDASPAMIEACKLADPKVRVVWHCAKAEEFQFRSNAYRLIISYEAFHLFDQPILLLRRLIRALRNKGNFGVGWCDYFWQEPLREIIVQTFAAYGIPWADWGYQRCAFLDELIAKNVPSLSICSKLSVKAASNWSPNRIALFLSSIGKAAHLSESDRRDLRHALENQIIDSGVPETGLSEYSMKIWTQSAAVNHL